MPTAKSPLRTGIRRVRVPFLSRAGSSRAVISAPTGSAVVSRSSSGAPRVDRISGAASAMRTVGVNRSPTVRACSVCSSIPSALSACSSEMSLSPSSFAARHRLSRAVVFALSISPLACRSQRPSASRPACLPARSRKLVTRRSISSPGRWPSGGASNASAASARRISALRAPDSNSSAPATTITRHPPCSSSMIGWRSRQVFCSICTAEQTGPEDCVDSVHARSIAARSSAKKF